MLKTISTKDSDFEKKFDQILSRSDDLDFAQGQSVLEIVSGILRDMRGVREKRDAVLIQKTEELDGHRPSSLEVSKDEIEAAKSSVGRQELRALKTAHERIQAFHREQSKRLTKSWQKTMQGISVGEVIQPIERVGIYVPGGLAAYPSTVFMNTVPAKIAGVGKIIMVSPWPQGQSNPYTLVAADMAGVDRIFKIGGAQAIAALAYGTPTIPAVDKIVGPGNIFVATAKKLVFGKVGIDMIAGPTEVVVIADEMADPAYIASDLLSQAEHDPRAVAILLTPPRSVADQVEKNLREQLNSLNRRSILEKALEAQGLTVITKDLDEAAVLANRLAPEHLEIQVRNPKKIFKKIRHAGAIFLGSLSPVTFGDYLAGPNHVLPTSGTARFSSPLGVSDFLKRSSLIEVKEAGLRRLGPDVMALAHMEGLTAHALSVQIRLK